MSDSESRRQISSAIRRIAGKLDFSEVQILFAKVESVDESNRTCIVIPITGPSDTSIEDVSLSIDRNDGEVKIPTIGSTVGIALSTEIDPFVFAWSDIDKITWKGGDYSGLAKVKELTEKINNLESEINDLKQIITTWVPVPSDGGAALKSMASSWASQPITKTQQSEIESQDIKHGSK